MQVEEYGKAENTDKLVYVLVDVGNLLKVKKLKELHEDMFFWMENITIQFIMHNMVKNGDVSPFFLGCGYTMKIAIKG